MVPEQSLLHGYPVCRRQPTGHVDNHVGIVVDETDFRTVRGRRAFGVWQGLELQRAADRIQTVFGPHQQPVTDQRG